MNSIDFWEIILPIFLVTHSHLAWVRSVVVQAKRHSKNVGINAAQEAQAAIAHYKAQEAWVVSNRTYTNPAIQLADANGVRLIDRDELIKMVLQMNPGAVPDPEQVRREVPWVTDKCKKCGRDMVIRDGATTGMIQVERVISIGFGLAIQAYHTHLSI